jgi:DNA-binding LacI/PurR family transcriptional regulator
MKTTIYDIAKATGFSASTVSRALNGTGYCNPKTKAKILEAAHALHYSPSNAGRALKSQRSNRILFCIPDIMNPFYFEMIQGATDVLNRHNFHCMLCYTQHSEAEELKYLDLLSEQYGDGMIMVSFNFSEAITEKINHAYFPVVTTNLVPKPHTDDRFDTVYIDHIRAMYLATQTLIDKGHRQIAIAVGDPDEQTGRERLRGYQDCLKDHGLPYKDLNVFVGDYTIASGKHIADRILVEGKDFTGLVSANDLMALGIVSRLQAAGFTLPDDLSIVSLDNSDYADAVHPGLTSVDMKQYEIGKTSAELLLERILDKRQSRKVIRLEPGLVERQSVKVPV